MTLITDENATFMGNSTNELFVDFMLPDWSRILFIIFLLITGILAVSGNGIILLVERKNKCKTSTDWLVSCMAANDLAFATVNIPVHVVLQLGNWKPLGSDGLCKVHVFVQRMTMYSSTLLLCIIALDRYWKTCRPHRKFLTQQRAFKVCILITIASCVVCSPLPSIIVYEEPTRCSHINLGGALTKAVTGVVSLTFAVMFVVVCACYIKVALTIKRKLIQNSLRPQRQFEVNVHDSSEKGNTNDSSLSMTSTVKRSRGIRQKRSCKVAPENLKDSAAEARRIQNSTECCKEVLFDPSNNHLSATGQTNHVDVEQRQKPGSVTQERIKGQKLTDARIDRTTKIMFAVTLVFILSWVPTWMVVFYKQVAKSNISPAGEIFALFGSNAFVINTFTNPIFYIWLSSTFKERAKKLLRALFVCQNI